MISTDTDQRNLTSRVGRNLPLFTLFLVVIPSAHGQAEVPPDDVTREVLRFTQFYEALAHNYVDVLDPDQLLFNGAIRGMLSSLDPFSAFFDQGQFELLQQQARGEARGFGSILYVQPGKVLVLQTAQGSPSWRAGLGPGDEIVEINGSRVDRLDFNSLVALLQKSKSQAVRLGVIRPGRVLAQDFSLQPASVALPTVDRHFLLDGTLGYVHIQSFESKTPQELSDAIQDLQSLSHSSSPGGVKGLLLDLRDNHGGMLEAALGVVSLFISPNQLVLTVRGRSVPEKTYSTVKMPVQFDLPLVVLVNAETASSAEVVAAALQEHDRAVIAGQATYGKGVVETVVGLSSATGLALTTAQYFTPSGRSIQRPLPGTALESPDSAVHVRSAGFHTDDGRTVEARGGVTPDVALPEPDLDPWLKFLEQHGALSAFAADYFDSHGKVTKEFSPGDAEMVQFKRFLERGQIRVPDQYWEKDQPYLRLRMKVEIFNLVFGLAYGDEVQTSEDLQVQKAAALIPRVRQILKGPSH